MPFERVKQFKEITVVYQSEASATLTVSTDLPSPPVQVRRTFTLATSTTRKNLTCPLDDPSLLEGNLIKIKIDPVGVFRLFGASVKAREIGVYIDGAHNEIWETQELALGVG